MKKRDTKLITLVEPRQRLTRFERFCMLTFSHLFMALALFELAGWIVRGDRYLAIASILCGILSRLFSESVKKAKQ